MLYRWQKYDNERGVFGGLAYEKFGRRDGGKVLMTVNDKLKL